MSQTTDKITATNLKLIHKYFTETYPELSKEGISVDLATAKIWLGKGNNTPWSYNNALLASRAWAALKGAPSIDEAIKQLEDIESRPEAPASAPESSL